MKMSWSTGLTGVYSPGTTMVNPVSSWLKSITIMMSFAAPRSPDRSGSKATTSPSSCSIPDPLSPRRDDFFASEMVLNMASYIQHDSGSRIIEPRNDFRIQKKPWPTWKPESYWALLKTDLNTTSKQCWCCSFYHLNTTPDWYYVHCHRAIWLQTVPDEETKYTERLKTLLFFTFLFFLQ